MNTCYIFGSLPVSSFNFETDETDLIIAADKGLENTKKFNIMPHIIIGDFDSLQFTPEGENVIKHPVMKDDTDLMLSIKYGLEKGYKTFYIFGCVGERLDHTIASVQAAAFVKENGGHAFFYGYETFLTIIEKEKITFSDNCSGIISVFSYTENADVTISGLLYQVENVTINQNNPLGVSNEFIGKKSSISSHSGKALIICNTNNTEFTLGE